MKHDISPSGFIANLHFKAQDCEASRPFCGAAGILAFRTGSTCAMSLHRGSGADCPANGERDFESSTYGHSRSAIKAKPRECQHALPLAD